MRTQSRTQRDQSPYKPSKRGWTQPRAGFIKSPEWEWGGTVDESGALLDLDRVSRHSHDSLDQILVRLRTKMGSVNFQLQGYLAHKKQHPPRTPQKPSAQGPMVILWGWVFLMSEVPLYAQERA